MEPRAVSRRAPLLSVEEALARMLAAAAPLPTQSVPLAAARGRALCAPVQAIRSHPAFDVSAMDGYAVRGADTAEAGAPLALTGSLAAGDEHGRKGEAPRIGAGEAMRIFTGARLPEGADGILVQENARAEAGRVHALQPVRAGRYVRRKGSDFRAGERLLHAGRRLSERDLALLAAMGHVHVRVHRRPRIALLALGSELAAAGESDAADKLVSSNSVGMAGLVERLGGQAVDLGIVRDDVDEIVRALGEARGCDLLATMGGASVGEHDLTRVSLEKAGFAIGFHGVAMRPGKPLLFAADKNGLLALGLPGNPVSTLVCAEVFLRPLADRLQGGAGRGLACLQARLARDLEGNDERQEYMRARLERDADGGLAVEPFAGQDSARLSALSRADALAIRPPHAPKAAAGDSVAVLVLEEWLARGGGGSMMAAGEGRGGGDESCPVP